MSSKRIVNVSVAQLTVQGATCYPWAEITKGEATFSASYGTCYFQGKTFTKIKGGVGAGNYVCAENGEIYRIWQDKKSGINALKIVPLIQLITLLTSMWFNR